MVAKHQSTATNSSGRAKALTSLQGMRLRHKPTLYMYCRLSLAVNCHLGAYFNTFLILGSWERSGAGSGARSGAGHWELELPEPFSKSFGRSRCFTECVMYKSFLGHSLECKSCSLHCCIPGMENINFRSLHPALNIT